MLDMKNIKLAAAFFLLLFFVACNKESKQTDEPKNYDSFSKLRKVSAKACISSLSGYYGSMNGVSALAAYPKDLQKIELSEEEIYPLGKRFFDSYTGLLAKYSGVKIDSLDSFSMAASTMEKIGPDVAEKYGKELAFLAYELNPRYFKECLEEFEAISKLCIDKYEEGTPNNEYMACFRAKNAPMIPFSNKLQKSTQEDIARQFKKLGR